MTEDALPGLVTQMVVVRPGAKLIVGLSEHLTVEAAARLKQQAADAMPGVDAVFIECVRQFAVYRPGDSDPAGESGGAGPDQ